MNKGQEFASGVLLGITGAGAVAFILFLVSLYNPSEGKFYYPWHETESICVQAEKQNCKVEYKKVYVADNRRYDYEQ